MSLPTIEPLPDEYTSLPPARRRRQRRMIIPPDKGERADFLRDLSRRTVPSFDFFLFSLLAGLVLGLAILMDAPALFLLAALLAPFMAPVIGIALGTITGAGRFTLQSLGSLSIGSLIVFLCGAIAGWVANLLPQRAYSQAVMAAQFSWPGLLVLGLGAGLTAYLIARAPQQRPLVTSVAIAYALYLPAGAAGFGMSSGLPGLWPNGLALFFIHLIWSALMGTIVLGFLGLRPLNAVGYLLTALYAVTGVASVALILAATPASPVTTARPAQGLSTEAVTFGVETEKQSTPTPSPRPATSTSQPTITRTLVNTPTRTLVPTRTVTLTITPQATPVWARISASQGNGALIREQPDYDAPVVQSLLNDNLVEVLNEVQNNNGVVWVHVRIVNGKEGWIVRDLLRTATPAPGW